MQCPLCNQRKARRACPALGQQICAVCCGTKRLVEIRCPATCGYLVSARTHPPAVVQRQQQRDRETLLPALEGLTDRQGRLFVLMASLISRHRAEALNTLIDDDIAQAAEALAATLETAGRGIVYEHQPASRSAQRLVTDLKAFLTELSREGGSALDRDAATVLRRIERGAREAHRSIEGAETAFQQLLARLMAPSSPGPASATGGDGESQAPAGSAIVIP